MEFFSTEFSRRDPASGKLQEMREVEISMGFQLAEKWEDFENQQSGKHHLELVDVGIYDGTILYGSCWILVVYIMW